MSNLIEQLGGYEAAKRAIENGVLKDWAPCTYEVARRELLEYRRAHNIYEIGDFVMYEGKLYEIKYIYHSERARITDGFQGRTIYDFPKGIRHALDDDLPPVISKLEVLDDIDIPPNTIILGDR